jgi:septum site-determining protein MinD
MKQNTRVIVITSGKGGVGKTTTASNIGLGLARLGKKVCLMDGDIGLRNLDLLLGLENRVIYTGTDIVAGDCSMQQALIIDKRNRNLTFFPLSASKPEKKLRAQDIYHFVKALRNENEFILIDCPAGIDSGFEVAIYAAEESIVVVTPEISSVRDADKVIGILESKGIQKNSAIINRLRPKLIEGRGMMAKEDVYAILGLPILGIVPDSRDIVTSSNRGEPIVIKSDTTTSGRAFENIARRLCGEEVPYLKFDEPEKKNFFSRLFRKKD